MSQNDAVSIVFSLFFTVSILLNTVHRFLFSLRRLYAAVPPPFLLLSIFMEGSNPVSEISRTQRVVLVIDLNPLLHLSDPAPYLCSVLASARTILSFSALSRSLFSFKLFFSSLSPFLSSSRIPNSSLSLSFDLPCSTIASLSRVLSSLDSLRDPDSSSSPRASYVASSLRELVHDYGWDPVIDDPVSGSSLSSVFRSNLVVLFSPIRRSVKWVSEFLGCGGDGSLRTVDGFRENFCGVFENVRVAFAGKDIHVSWVDVKFGEDDDSGLGFGDFENWIKDLGWGFCSTDSIVLGSAVVPFGLIYPKIGISPKSLDLDDCSKKIQAQLSLDILDVNGKPLECKCCDLEIVSLTISPRNRCDDVVYIPEHVHSLNGDNEQKNTFWGQFSGGAIKIHVKAVHRYNEFVKIEGKVHDLVLVRESLEKTGKRRKDGSGEFVVDKVLEMLAMEMGENVQTKSDPIWQILLSFLYREGYWALVSVVDDDGSSCMGILNPFTVSSGLLSVIDTSYHGEITKPCIDAKTVTGLIDSQFGKKRRNKKKSISNKELSWSTFCKAAFEHAEVNLEEVYFGRTSNSSKKLKFLKCWMKQVQKSSSTRFRIDEPPKNQQDIPKDERLTELLHESEQPIFASVGECSLTGASRVQDDVIHGLCSETSDAFFSNLPEKIQQGVESEGVDLGALAERLVKSSVHWLCQKCETEGQIASVELTKLLLREPKEMAEKHKNDKSSGNTRPSSEHIVREYEIQILFRLEILRSEVGASVTESTKSKFVRQICSLLENVQCHLEGGFFGDWSLDDYVGKIIKNRYVNTLGDTVHKIYTKMDLLLFADDSEPILNSEESKQSPKHNPARRETTKPPSTDNAVVSEEDESPNPPEDGLKMEEHARRTKQAQERRERARRFSSFSTWVPDLQRVWAPKQQKTVKAKPHCVQMASKRADRRRGDEERVCETPLTGRKRSYGEGSSDEELHISGTNSSSSVSRSLFQDGW